MLYFDDILVQDIDEEEERRRNLEKRLKTMQFERPWLIKRLTNTYYRKSKQDYVHFEEKVKKLRRQFKSRANRMSVNLEQIMYKKRGKDPFLSNESQLPEQTAANLIEDQSRVHLNAGNFNSQKVQSKQYPKKRGTRVILPFSPISTSPFRIQHDKSESGASKISVQYPSPRSKLESIERHIQIESARTLQPQRMKRYGEPSIESDPRSGLPIGLDSENKNCLICFNSSADGVLLKCGHGGICYQCGCELIKSTQVCHLCRQKFNKVLQLDLNNTAFNYINVIAMTYLEGEEEEQVEIPEEEKSSFSREQIQTESDQRRNEEDQESKEEQKNQPPEAEESKTQGAQARKHRKSTLEFKSRELELSPYQGQIELPKGESSQIYLTPLDLVSYKSETGERPYDSYLESTLRGQEKSGEKKINLGSQFTTEREMLDAIREVIIPNPAPDIVPIFTRTEVARNDRNETPYNSVKLPKKKRPQLRVMSIVMKNQDPSGLTSLTITQRDSRINSNSGDVVWDSTDKKLYLASLQHDVISEKEFHSAMHYEEVKEEEMHPQGYLDTGEMIRVQENEYEHEMALNEDIGNRRMLNLGGMLREIKHK